MLQVVQMVNAPASALPIQNANYLSEQTTLLHTPEVKFKPIGFSMPLEFAITHQMITMTPF